MKHLIYLPPRKEFIVPRSGDKCKIRTKYTDDRIEVHDITKGKISVFDGNLLVIPKK